MIYKVITYPKTVSNPIPNFSGVYKSMTYKPNPSQTYPKSRIYRDRIKKSSTYADSLHNWK